MNARGFARCITARTSCQGGCEGDDQVPAHRRNRVCDMSFGADGWRLGVYNFGKCQTSRIDRLRRRLRGKVWPARRSGRHKPRCTRWRDGGVMMEATPAPSFVVPEAEFLFQLLVIALDPPTQFREIDQAIEGHVRREGGQPVFGGLGLTL